MIEIRCAGRWRHAPTARDGDDAGAPHAWLPHLEALAPKHVPQEAGTTVDDLLKLNNLTDANFLKLGAWDGKAGCP